MYLLSLAATSISRRRPCVCNIARVFHATARSQHRPWTSDEDSLLDRLVVEGKTYAYISTQFHSRSQAAVKARLSLLRRQNRGPPRSIQRQIQWRAADLERLSKAKQSGLTLTQIVALFPGYSLFSLIYRLRPMQDNAHLKGVPYSHDEDNKIRVLRHQQGLDWTAISRQMPGRTPTSILSRYLLITPHRDRLGSDTSWKPAEVAQLKCLTDAKASTQQIAEALGRSQTAIRQKRHHLKSTSKIPPNHERKCRWWTDEETSRLWAMYNSGTASHEIAQRLERSVPSVQDRIFAIRLGGVVLQKPTSDEPEQ